RIVEIEVVLLHVLAVVALAVGQPEQPFFQDRVAAVPQRQREAEPLPIVGDARQAIFAPSIGPGPSLVVSEIIPGVAPFAIVLPAGPPLPLAEVRPPPFPRTSMLPGLFESDMFFRHTVPPSLHLLCSPRPITRTAPRSVTGGQPGSRSF